MEERSELPATTSSMCDPSLVAAPKITTAHGQHAPVDSPTTSARTPSPSLPEIPAADLDLTLSFDSIMGKNLPGEPHAERVQKRASNVLKLTQENEKLKEELRAMSARLEAAERRRQEIAGRQLQQTLVVEHGAGRPRHADA